MTRDKKPQKDMNVKRLTPIKAIRAKCLDCSGDSRKEVRLCPIHTCPIYPYRMGKRPKAGEQGQESKKSN